MLKKIIAAFLAIVTVCSFAACSKKDEHKLPTEPSNFLNYELEKDEDSYKYIVTGISGNIEEVTEICIPSSISYDFEKENGSEMSGYLVFPYYKGEIKVKAEDFEGINKESGYEVTEIDYFAFANAENLTAINIPASVIEISGNAFENCKSLTHVELPEHLMFLTCSMFNGCSSLEYVKIPQRIMAIEDSAFLGCEKLKEIEYSGTKEDWESLLIFEEGNDMLKKATINCTEKSE